MTGRLLLTGTVLAAVVGVLSGLASGLFLESLAKVTDLQRDNRWLLFMLPLAGAVIGWAYSGVGKPAAGGHNLILEHFHDKATGNRVPLRMLPLVLTATLATHLFGGSAGREGTAVQMGGAISAWLARRLSLSADPFRLLLMCGISGGFSSVFGTPLAGTVFALEVIAIGGVRTTALIPCLIAAVAGDLTIRWMNVEHAHYAILSAIPEMSLTVVAHVTIAGVAFGLASLAFSEGTWVVERVAGRLFPNLIVRGFAGGIVVIIATLILGTRDYNGLSLPLLTDSFTGVDVATFAFLFKIGLTALTLGFGFKGGEVTPLFVIGATLGVTLSNPLSLEPDFLAALGFVAVFAAAANTPIACVVMGAELFGSHGIVFYGIAVFVAYTISGHRGIYHAQRVEHPKLFRRHGPDRDATIAHLRTSSAVRRRASSPPDQG